MRNIRKHQLRVERNKKRRRLKRAPQTPRRQAYVRGDSMRRSVMDYIMRKLATRDLF